MFRRECFTERASNTSAKLVARQSVRLTKAISAVVRRRVWVTVCRIKYQATSLPVYRLDCANNSRETGRDSVHLTCEICPASGTYQNVRADIYRINLSSLDRMREALRKRRHFGDCTITDHCPSCKVNKLQTIANGWNCVPLGTISQIVGIQYLSWIAVRFWNVAWEYQLTLCISTYGNCGIINDRAQCTSCFTYIASFFYKFCRILVQWNFYAVQLFINI